MNILLVVGGVVVAIVLAVVAVMVLRPDLLRLEQIQPIESTAVLAELRARIKAFSEMGFWELAGVPEDALDKMEIEGVEVVFRTFRSEIEDDSVGVVVVAEIVLGGTEHQPHVGSACVGFSKTRDENVTTLGVDELGPHALDMDVEIDDSPEPRSDFDSVSPPGPPSEQQRPIRVVEYLRIGGFRSASLCSRANLEWTAGMDELEAQIVRFADRVGRTEESQLSSEHLNEQIDVLGRRGAIFAFVDDSSGDRPRVVIAAMAPIARWPLGRWMIVAAYARNRDGSSSWLRSDEVSEYW